MLCKDFVKGWPQVLFPQLGCNPLAGSQVVTAKPYSKQASLTKAQLGV
jgi:hypothetical protein